MTEKCIHNSDSPNNRDLSASETEFSRDSVRNTLPRSAVDDLCAKVEADAVAGLRYIERRYGRLEGVGWDRVFETHDELFQSAALRSGKVEEPTPEMIEAGARQLYKDYEDTTDGHVETVFSPDACPGHKDLADEMRSWFTSAVAAMLSTAPLGGK